MFKAYVWDLSNDAMDFLINVFDGLYGSDGTVMVLDPEINLMDYYESDSNAAVLLTSFSEVKYFEYITQFQDNLFKSKKFIRFSDDLDSFITSLSTILGYSEEELRGYMAKPSVVVPEVVVPEVHSYAGSTLGTVPNVGRVEPSLASLEAMIQQYAPTAPVVNIPVTPMVSTTTQGTASELEQLRVLHTNLSSANVKLKSKNEELKTQVEQLQARDEVITRLLKDAQDVINSLKSNSKSVEDYNKLEAELLTTKGRVRDLERRSDSLDTDLLNKERELSQVTNQLAQEQSKSLRLQDSLTKVQNELSEEKEKTNIDDLRSEVDKMRHELVAENDKLGAKNQELVEANNALQQRLSEADSKIIKLSASQAQGIAKKSLPDRFTKFSGLVTQPPPVREVFKRTYPKLRFIFTGSSHSTRTVYTKLQTEIKRVTQDKSKKVIFVDLSAHPFSYYRFGLQVPAGSKEWLEKGGDIRKYTQRGTKGANSEREMYYSIGGFAQYINEFSFYFIDFNARFSELNALEEEVIVYLGDATTGFGSSMFASLVAKNKVEVLLSSETFSIGSFYGLIMGTQPNRENLTIRFFDYTNQVDKYYKNLKQAKYNLSIYDRKTGK